MRLLGKRDLILVAHWRQQPQANTLLIEKPHQVDIDLAGGGFEMAKPGSINLYDCLNYFSMEETLSGNDKWYCSKCKDHVNAQKKMEIYRAPNYLIIHLKRFSHQRHMMFGSRKLNDFINFPVTGLNMTPYIKSDPSGQHIYDLYAISNHFGSLNGGHYTAFAKNPVYQKWYNFDDSDVSRASASDVVTKAAYVLFFRKRQK